MSNFLDYLREEEIINFWSPFKKRGIGFLIFCPTVFLLFVAVFLLSLSPFVPVCISFQDVSSCPLVEEIVAFFPVLEGYIVEVKGDMIFLDLGRSSGVRKGMEFLCIREGEEFTHPLTGVVLGRFEDKLGYIQVTEISENYSIGKIQQNFSGKVIQRGDKIRITTSKIPIALPPDLPPNPKIKQLVDGLEQSGRFTIIPASSIISAFKEMDLSDFDGMTSDQIKKISEKLDISAIIIPSVEESPLKDYINARIISARTGFLITELSYECGEGDADQLWHSATMTPQVTQDSKKISEKFTIPLQGGITNIANLSQSTDEEITNSLALKEIK